MYCCNYVPPIPEKGSKGVLATLSDTLTCVCPQSKDQSLNSRSVPKPRVNDGLKMRASVRMTRYLESWGAVKPFAHLQSREGFTTDAMVNGKSRCKVSRLIL